MPDHVWGNEWFAQSLRHREFPWWVRDNYVPEGGVLWHIDPVGGLFRWVLLFLPPEWIWNLYIFTQVLLFTLMVYWWAVRHRLKRSSAVFVSLMVVHNSYVAGLIHSGLSEYLGLGGLVLLCMSLEKRAYWQAGILLMCVSMQSFVMGTIAGLYCLIHLFAQRWVCSFVDWRQRLRPLFGLYFPSTLVVLPMVWLCWQTLQHPDALFSSQEAPGWNFRHLPIVDLYGYVAFGDWVFPDTRTLNPGVVQTHSLGWAWWGMVLVGMCLKCKDEVHLKTWMIFAVFAMGPVLSICNWKVFSGMGRLPLSLLYLPFSPFSWVHHPYHMAGMLLVAGLPFVFDALKQLELKWKGWAVLWYGLLLGWGDFELQKSPIPQPFVRSLYAEDVAVEGARLDFPPDLSTANRQYVLQQLRHKEPIAYGINQWLPKTLLNDSGVQRWLHLLENVQKRSQNRDIPSKPIQLHPVSTEPTQLAEMGFEWLVVHGEFLSLQEKHRLLPLLDQELGEPILQSEEIWVYSLSVDSD